MAANPDADPHSFDVERPKWEEDSHYTECKACKTEFGFFTRKHHCRMCGEVYCGSCTSNMALIPLLGYFTPVRHCAECYEKRNEVPVGDNERYFVNARGTLLYSRRWPAVGELRGTLFCVHGTAEHINNYEEVMSFFANQGYNCYGYDLVGHGRSYGLRLVIDNFQHYIDDTLQFVRETLAEQEKTQAVHPRFLLCHSLGTIIGLSAYIQDKSLFDGLLASGCAAFVDPNLATPTKVTVANWLGSLMPTFVVGKLDNGSQLSKDREYVARAVVDPFRVTTGITASFASNFLKGIESLKQNVAEITAPIRVMHGADDKLVMVAGSEFVMENCGSQDKELKIYENMEHEILNEVERETVYNEILAWIQAHSN